MAELKAPENLWMRCVIEIECPSCGALPRASCVIVKKDGVKITGVHTARRDALRDRTAGMR